MRRVAVLDFDVHHGNGNAALVADNPALLYVSSHQSPLFPGTGTAAGRDGRSVNAPLPPRAGSAEFREAWREALLPIVVDFGADALFVSAGFDAHRNDPLSALRLREDDFGWLTAQIVRLGLPVVSVLEGGYDLPALRSSVRAHVEALAQCECGGGAGAEPQRRANGWRGGGGRARHARRMAEAEAAGRWHKPWKERNGTLRQRA